jgi:MFS superfamily sulfate permease-like transporter
LPFDEPLIYGLIVLGVILACLIIIYAMRKRGKKEEKLFEEEKSKMELKALPFRIEKSISREDATHARDELRTLDLEREILSGAIRRLYEAHAEGKITEEERERIAQAYKSRMMTVKEAISKDESLVALHELEAMQEDLMKLFSERFDELSTKVDELRSKVEVKPIKEITIPAAKKPPTMLTEKPAKKEVRRKKKPAKPSPRTEAEKRIERIRAEVEKVLEKLGQMEIET